MCQLFISLRSTVAGLRTLTRGLKSKVNCRNAELLNLSVASPVPFRTRNPKLKIRNAEPETHVINFHAIQAMPPKPVMSASSSIQKLALCKPPVSAFEVPFTPKR